MGDIERDECERCEGTGGIEVPCSCGSQPPQYQCKRCGNCGIVEIPCPDCSPDDDDFDEPDDSPTEKDEAVMWGGKGTL